MNEVVSFFIQSSLTNVVFGFALFSFLHFSIRDASKDRIELFIYSMGFAPILVTLILYYLLWLLPCRSCMFYFLITAFPFLVFIGLLSKSKAAFRELLHDVMDIYRHRTILFILANMLVIFWVIVWIYTVINIHLENYDIIDYALMGKIFFQNKAITYQAINFYENYGYMYRGLHGYSYPLFSTWNNITNQVLGGSGDLYVRSVAGYYIILTAILCFYKIFRTTRNNYFLASLAGALFLINPSLYYMMYSYNIDPFRIFYLTAAMFMFLNFISNANLYNLVLFGIISGLTANSHAIGAVFVPVFLCAYLLFGEKGLLLKVKECGLILAVALIFGGGHYIVEIIWGAGWIFNVASGANLVIVERATDVIGTDYGACREIGTPMALIINGYLGQILRFNYVGVINFFTILVILLLFILRFHLPQWKKALLFCYLLFIVVIALKGYANPRYFYTTMAVSFFILFVHVKEVLERISKPIYHLVLSVIIILSVTLFACTTFHLPRVFYYPILYKLTQHCPELREKDAIAEIIRDEQTNSIWTAIDKVNKIEKSNKNILLYGNNIFYYYTNHKYLYYIADVLFTKDGLTKLMGEKPDEEIEALFKNVYQFEYVIICKNQLASNTRINQYLQKNTIKIFETTDIILYKL